ncbi:response regulator [Vampirovibrio chlorellavorus]|uniref:response regulator n=1 Tax=Vampirovibrio chlorellavorus TaxID=758823 RepID=UPI0026EF47D4|nr:response regulator transcription factor [Vampirovibrio chlorellavorus]
MNPPSLTRPAQVLIVEDHELARFGLSMALAEKEGLEIVGEAENGQQGVDLALDKKPDLILMDIGMPVMDGITATLKIKEALPEIKVLMLTSIQNHEEVLASMAAGADAYCMKDIKMDRLYQVIQMVLDGAIWLDPAIARMVMQTLPVGMAVAMEPSAEAGLEAGDGKKAQGRVRYNAELTERELEVLKCIVDGKSNKEIALSLQVSAHTAKAHVASIIQKLSVDDRTQVAVKALREGLV